MQPPASLEALGDPIYEAFYGLTEQPFAISTDPRFFYLSAAHQRAYSELLNGLRRHESLLLVTGETGTGKTTLCRTVLAALGDRTFSALILNPYMAGAEVLRIVLRDFGFVSHEDLRRGALASADVPQLLDTLEGFLKSLQPLAAHAVIVIDEAQSLAPTILDQIRMLTALEHDHRRLVQVVLCGQPSLLDLLKTDPLHALNERITRRVELTALSPNDVEGYIAHRLGVAGGGDAVRFDAAATAAVADLSRGLPRRINVLCDRALQEGRIEGASIITTDLVKRAARAVAGVHEPIPAVPPPPPPVHVVAAPHVAVPPPATPARVPSSRAAMPEAVIPVGPARVAHTGISAPAAFDASATADDESRVDERTAPASETSTDYPELSFGQKAEPQASPFKKIVLAAAAVAVVATGGYFAWAWSAGTPEAAVPEPPTRRVLNSGAPAAPIAVPGPEELEILLTAPLNFFRPATPAPASFDPAPSDVVAPDASGQNPDNGNQVN